MQRLYQVTKQVYINSYSASHDSWWTGILLNRIITAQWEGMQFSPQHQQRGFKSPCADKKNAMCRGLSQALSVWLDGGSSVIILYMSRHYFSHAQS